MKEQNGMGAGEGGTDVKENKKKAQPDTVGNNSNFTEERTIEIVGTLVHQKPALFFVGFTFEMMKYLAFCG